MASLITPFCPLGGSIGGSQVVTPDTPFSVDDLTSDSIFYVQNGQAKGQAAPRDVVSFYVSDGQSQTETFNVEIDIQVAAVGFRHSRKQLLEHWKTRARGP